MPRSAHRFRLTGEGESPIALVGMAASVILLAAVFSAAWCSASGNAEAMRRARSDQFYALAGTLSQGAETMLASGDVSALRRLIVDTRRNWHLLECRVKLSDGRIIADADPARINQLVLPDKWTATPADEPAAPRADAIVVTQPLKIMGRGGATLELVCANEVSAAAAWWEPGGAAGLICAASLGLLLLVYRRSRMELVPMDMIRRALVARGGGELSASALAVAGAGRPETAAWNDMLTEAEGLRRTLTVAHARDALTQRAQTHGDLEQACDALSQGLIILDEQNRVAFANGAAAVFLQAKRDAVTGSLAEKFIPHTTVREAIQAAATGAARHRQLVEVEQQDSGGTAVLRFGVRPLRREQASGTLITIEDITQQRNSEASRNSFIAQATHELRTPLTNIGLYLEMIQDSGENDPAVRAKCLNVIGQETRRLDRTVGEMLSVAQIEAGSLELNKDDVRLDRLFAELEADYRAQADEKKQELTFDLSPKLPVIQGDQSKLTASIHNLVGNALKYTPAGGKVTVKADTDDKVLKVDITDSGIGIDEKEHELIFNRFYRAKDPRVGKITGSGLGLALAREVARLHGGDVTVQSRLNQGSTFTLIVPLGDATA
ncbi:MAG: ATP-binding protein [Planctomycetota bacterium]|nr:ATP-binding protein [Planctomycetota bacterium]